MASYSHEMYKDYNDGFRDFDPKGKGFIEHGMVKLALRHVGLNPTDQELERLFMEVDMNCNGKIEFAEFIELIERLNNKAKANVEGISLK